MSYSAANAIGVSWASWLCSGLLYLYASPALSAPHITLTWQDNATLETYESVERQACCGVNFSALPSLPADTITWTDTAVTPGVVYCYRVRACNPAGCSAYSNVGCGVIPQGGQ